MLKINADINDLTAKPSTNLSHKSTIPALMTNKKSPKVTIVTGKVNNTKIGFKNTLSTPKTTATITEVVKFTTAMSFMK